MAKFKIARNVTRREYFEVEAVNEEAMRAALHQLNNRITEGEDYSVEDDLNAEFVDEKDINTDNTFEFIGEAE